MIYNTRKNFFYARDLSGLLISGGIDVMMMKMMKGSLHAMHGCVLVYMYVCTYVCGVEGVWEDSETGLRS